MNASTNSGAAASPVIFKRKRGPASRTATSTSTSTNAEASSSSSNAAGPSRASYSVSNGANSRDDSDSDDEASGASSAVVIKKKRPNKNPLLQSTGSVLRRSKLGGGSDDGLDDDTYGLEDSEVKSRNHASTYKDRFGDSGITSSHRASSANNASTSTSTRNDSLAKIREDATRHSDWDLETTASSSLKDAPETSSSSSNADGLYRGAKSYTSYIAARDDGTSSKMRSRGPIRQTTTVRTTSLMDYQPDICKDYKETGYCGFGDTCKFLHDRSDYLAGWQLDVLPNSNAASRTRENVLLGLSDPESDADAEAKEEEEVPFACLICRQPFTDPIVTKCGHYFCQACALRRFASKSSKCFACGAQTAGLFNSAHNILRRLNRQKHIKHEAKRERNSWINRPTPDPDQTLHEGDQGDREEVIREFATNVDTS